MQSDDRTAQAGISPRQGISVKILSALAGVFLAGLVAATVQAETVHYDYDAASNRTGETVRKNDGTLIKELKYHYDAAGRLSTIENLTDPAQTETFSYDGNGNQISRTVGTQQTTYAFDARDQLTTVEKSDAGSPPVLQARYRYNADGMRIDGEENGQARRYTWDTDQLILTQEPDNTLSRYQWGPNRLSSLISTQNGVTHRDWYLFDALGSVTALISETGALSARYHFDAFGKIIEQTGDTNNRFTFTGHQHDDITGLYYFKARYYDPSQGRFVSEDSYEGTLQTPESRNHYLYAYANPTVYIDLTGYAACAAKEFAFNCDPGTGAANIKREKELASQRQRQTEVEQKVEAHREALRQSAEVSRQQWDAYCQQAGCKSTQPTTIKEGSAGLENTSNPDIEQILIERQRQAHGPSSVAKGFSTGGKLLEAVVTPDETDVALAGLGPVAVGVGKYKKIERILDKTSDLASASRDVAKEMNLVRKELPSLRKSFAAEFEGEVRTRTYKAGDRLHRSPWSSEATNEPGRWFGTRQTATKAGTDSQYQIEKFDNPNEKQRTYEFTQDVTVYYGKVKGGTGYQAYIPDDIDPASILKFAKEKPLK